jgi:hypothetical protein
MDERERAEPAAEISEERLEEIRRQRFQQRVERVLEVMQHERVDWRGLPFIAADGRIGVRVVPVDLPLGTLKDPRCPERGVLNGPAGRAEGPAGGREAGAER